MESILRTENLKVSYGVIQALKGITINVPKGKITAILGANGGGKSTLLKTLSGIVTETSGDIIYLDQSLRKVAPEKRTQKGIIHVPEGRQIFGELTVFENLMIGAFTVKKGTVPFTQLTETLKKATADQATTERVLTKKQIIANNIEKVFTYFPVLKERSDQMAITLSGGEQQMLAIGRALMGTPKLLILDEPSLGLAPLIVQSIFKILQELNQTGISILIVEQNALQTLKIADYGYVIQIGQMVKEGPAQTLLKDPALIEAYLGK